MKSPAEKGHSIPSQKRAAKVHGKSELMISPDVENHFLFHDSRKKEKELEGNGCPRQSFLVAGPSRSNRSMVRKHAEIANSSKKDEEVCGQYRKKGKNILCANKNGKMNLEDEELKDKQHVEPTIQSNRSFSLFGKIAVTTAKDNISSFASYQSLGSFDEKNLPPYLPNWRDKADTRDNNNWKKHISYPNHGQAFSQTVSGRRRNHGWEKCVNGHEKCKSLHSKCGEASGLTVNRWSYTQSHAENCKLKLDMSNKDKFSKLYPEIRGSNSNGQRNGFSNKFSAGVSQIESDELFARELQEKFNHETTRFIDMEKVDAKVARSLQNDEVAKAVSLAWQGQSNPQVLFEEFGNNLNNEVDLETRLELLEAVEEMHQDSYDDLEFSQSFNDNDYEMLTNLDEKINNFPLSVVQNDNNGEACPVCLDVPSVGETVRHLPCLHKFHQACIDGWLKRKPSCPVCKSRVA